MTDVLHSWPAQLAQHTQIRDRLLDAYGGPGRGYHNLRHLGEVVEHIDQIVAAEQAAVDHDAVLLAAWFHDAVYEPGADNEERSAVLAERELATVDAPAALVDEVARLVRLTTTHRPAPDDVAGQVLCDADLAILAADHDRYQEYVDGVRHEHADLPDEEFARGRAAVLHDLLTKPTLFHTRFAQQHWEDTARANIERELRDS